MAIDLLEKTVSRRAFTAASLNALFLGMAVTLIDCGGKSSYSSPTAPTSSGTGTGSSSGGTSSSSGSSSSGGSSSSSSSSGGGASADNSGTISSNHGHVAVVTSAQLLASGAVMLNIQGSADHNHTVTLGGDQVAAIARGQKITVTSSTDAGYDYSTHSHGVAFN